MTSVAQVVLVGHHNRAFVASATARVGVVKCGRDGVGTVDCDGNLQSDVCVGPDIRLVDNLDFVSHELPCGALVVQEAWCALGYLEDERLVSRSRSALDTLVPRVHTISATHLRVRDVEGIRLGDVPHDEMVRPAADKKEFLPSDILVVSKGADRKPEVTVLVDKGVALVELVASLGHQGNLKLRSWGRLSPLRKRKEEKEQTEEKKREDDSQRQFGIVETALDVCLR